MPTRLVLLAHAATTATRRAAFPAADDLLEPGADRRAFVVGRRLPAPDHLLCAPADAARQTALALPQAAGHQPRAEMRLRDLQCGRWTGRSLAEVGPDAARWLADPTFDDHGGESIAALCTRVRDWLDEGIAAPGLTLAVTHAAVVRAALVAVLGTPPGAFFRIDVAPLSALALSSDGRRWTMRAFVPPGRRPFSASAR